MYPYYPPWLPAVSIQSCFDTSLSSRLVNCFTFLAYGMKNIEPNHFLASGGSRPWGGGGASSPWDKGGGPVLNKKIFQPFRPQLGPKKGGAGPSPGSATACSHRNYTWSDQNFCAISLLEFVLKCLVLKRLVTPSPFSSPAWGKMQWNLDITECQRRGKIFLLQWGFVISRYFSINFTITGVKKIVRYTEDFLR